MPEEVFVGKISNGCWTAAIHTCQVSSYRTDPHSSKIKKLKEERKEKKWLQNIISLLFNKKILQGKPINMLTICFTVKVKCGLFFKP